MPSIWQDRLALVRGAVDRELGEAVRVTPMRADSQYSAAAPDPARAAFDVTAVLQVGEGDETNLDGGRARSWRAQIPRGEAEVHVDPVRFPGVRDVAQGDRIEALDRGSIAFEVARIDRRRRNRLTLRLTAI